MSFSPPPQLPPVSPPDGPPPGWRPVPLADFGTRLGAVLIDYAFYLAVSLVLVVPFIFWWFWVVIDAATHERQPSPWVFLGWLVFFAVYLVVTLAYSYIYFVESPLRHNGQTFGKRMLNIQVIPATMGVPLTRSHLVKRWAIQWVAGHLINVLFLIDGLWQLWDKPLQQCLHDKVADTIVVKAG